MRFVGLFSGIGGLELGLQRAGHSLTALCEIDPVAREVLAARFRGVPLHQDVRALKSLPKGTDLVVAGFPCQDLSQAGKAAGIYGRKSGIVQHVFRLLEATHVPWVLFENVPFMLRLNNGRAMRVLTDRLERLGYRWAYRTVNSLAFGVPHRRARVFLLASLNGDPREVLLSDDVGEPEIGSRDSVCGGFYWTEGNTGLGWAPGTIPPLKGGSAFGIPSAPAIVLPRGSIICPDIRDAERLQGFRADWTLPAEKVARHSLRWRLVGNAVTVPVASWVGRRLVSPRSYSEIGDTKLNRNERWPHAAWSLSDGAFGAEVSDWPTRRPFLRIDEFLVFDGIPLSLRASAGFLKRLKASTLWRPSRLVRRLERHTNRLNQNGQ